MSIAGWYPDPEDNQKLRWWDGETWTDRSRPSLPQPPTEVKSSPAAGSQKRTLPPRLGERAGDPSFPALKPSNRSLPEVRKLPPRPELPTPVRKPQIGAERPVLPPRISPSLPATSSNPPAEKQPNIVPKPVPGPGLPETARDVSLNYGFMPTESSDQKSSARDVGLSYGFSPIASNAVSAGEDMEEFTPELPLRPESSETPSVPQTSEAGKVKKFWTSTTIVVSSLAILATFLFPTSVNLLKESLYQRADKAAEGFLEGLENGGWVKYATPEAFDETFTPIYGDMETYESSGMSIKIARGEVLYNNPCGESKFITNSNPVGCSDQANAYITVTYSIGDSYEVVSNQTLQISRPFYYGDNEPSVAVKGKEATAVGDWSVSGVSINEPAPNSKYYPVGEQDSDQLMTCLDVDKMFVEMSISSRVDGSLSTICAVDKDDRITGETVNMEELVAGFPIYNEATILEFPNKTGVSSPYDLIPIPYSQFELETSTGTYLFSTILSENEFASSFYRLYSISKKGTTTEEETGEQ